MEAPANDSSFVICRCRQCEENIEFDAADFSEEFSLISCPHCGLETRLALPKELNHPLPGELATEAQLDYIRRLGLNPPPQLPYEAARLMIQEAPAAVKATEKQLELINAFEGESSGGFSRAEVDQIITRMLARQEKSAVNSSTPLIRQIQILRFWDRMDLLLYSKEKIAHWLNHFYDEDPRRQAAWEKFQTEYGDIWSDDPFWVPIGMSESYLQQV